MNTARPSIITIGQIYLNEQLNEYIIVTKNKLSHISYSGNNFKGQMESEDFIERFLPVDPADVSQEELNTLISFCPEGTLPKIGFIKD